MSQHDFTIENQGFQTTRGDLNSAIQALASLSGGPTEPSTKFANQLWCDTGTNTLKLRNKDNDAWILLAVIDQGNDNVQSITAQEIVTDSLTLGSTAVTASAADINDLKAQGRETIYVPAGAMYPTTTAGCSTLSQVELSLGPELKCLDFDQSTNESAQFTVCFPKSWNEGTVTFQAFFTATGLHTGTVAWGLSGVCLGESDNCNNSFGTNVVAAAKQHSGTTNDLNIAAESGPVTINTAAENEMTFFQIMRDTSADSLNGDARLLGIKLFFTTNGKNDT